MTRPNIQIPKEFAINGEKADFTQEKIQTGFDKLNPDIFAGDNANKFIDDTYKGLNGVLDLYNGIVLHDMTTTYDDKAVVGKFIENSFKLYRSLVNPNIGHEVTETEYWEEVALGGGGGLEVCDIGMALYVDEAKGKRRYLNGQIIDRNVNTETFFIRLQKITTLHPSLLCTEEEWQTAKTMSAFGQVGKFVFNYSGVEIVSVRLPRVVNIQGLFDLQNLGMTVSAGLPNITGQIEGTWSSTRNSAGALYSTDGVGIHSDGATKGGIALNIDASRSSDVYGNSNTVQPEAIQYPYFIQIATGSETKANIVNTLENVNGFTLLESKYSDKPLYNESWLLSNGQWNAKAVYPTIYEGLQVEYNTGIEVGTTVTLPSGVSYTKRGLSVKLSTEEYTDYDFVLNTVDETFRLPLKSKLASGKAVVGNGNGLGLTDGTISGGYIAIANANTPMTGSPHVTPDSYTPVGTKNDTYSNMKQHSSIGITTDPTKSGIELSDSGLYLYYYVGETVQNANLIDAGRIGEQLACKLDRGNKEEIIGWGMPDYSAGVIVSSTEIVNGYKAPYNGILMASYGFTSPKINNNALPQGDFYTPQSERLYQQTIYPLAKDDIFQCASPASPPNVSAIFYPLKGAN